MRTVEELSDRIQELLLTSRQDDIIGIKLEELLLLTGTIRNLKHELSKAKKEATRQRRMATSIYAESILSLDVNRYEEKV